MPELGVRLKIPDDSTGRFPQLLQKLKVFWRFWSAVAVVGLDDARLYDEKRHRVHIVQRLAVFDGAVAPMHPTGREQDEVVFVSLSVREYLAEGLHRLGGFNFVCRVVGHNVKVEQDVADQRSFLA